MRGIDHALSRDLRCALALALALAIGLGAAACSDPAHHGEPGVDAGRDAGDGDAGADAGVDPLACSPAATPPALDEPVPPGEARAGRASRASELIGGEGAYAQVDRAFVLVNDRVRFALQDAGTAAGYDLYGGNLVDADRARPAGETGNDLLRESFPIVGLRIPGAAQMSVVCDGSGGAPAVVRVVGEDLPSGVLPQLDSLAAPIGTTITTDYILAPGAEALEIRTTFTNPNGYFLQALEGDVLAFGASLTIFTPETGFGTAEAAGPVEWMAAVPEAGLPGRAVSYGYASPTSRIEVPFVDASGTGALIGTAGVAPRDRATFTRFFAVGTGDVASVAEILYAARGTAVGHAAGRTDAGASVFAFAGDWTLGATPVMQAVADAEGRYALPLPPGSYALVAAKLGQPRSAPAAVVVTAGETASIDLAPGRPGALRLDLVEQTPAGDPVGRVPVKVSLEGLDVEAPDAALGDLQGEREPMGLHRVVESVDGTGTFPVKPGRYRATASRGLEYDVVVQEIEVPADGEAVLAGALHRVVATPGEVSGDFHQHTVGSVDSGRALCARVLDNAAEGVEFPVTTDHDNTSDYRPCIDAQGLGAFLSTAVGNELSVPGVGHFNAYPLTVDPAEPYAGVGAQYWVGLSIAALAAKVAAEPGEPVLHVSHPRSGNGKGYFAWLGLDPTTLVTEREPLADGFAAIEVNLDLGAPEEFLPAADADIADRAMRDATSIPTLRDFFALVGTGLPIAPLANSDTHDRNGTTGYPRTMLTVGLDDPSLVTVDDVEAAIRGGRVRATSGAFVELRVDGTPRAGWEQVVRASGPLALELEVQAAPWVAVDTIELYENGRPLYLAWDGPETLRASADPASGGELALSVGDPLDPVVRLRVSLEVTPARDSTYVAVARGAAPLSPVNGARPAGYTSPLYVDADGGGWRP